MVKILRVGRPQYLISGLALFVLGALLAVRLGAPFSLARLVLGYLVIQLAQLSTRFGEIADVSREANYYAGQEKADLITASHVERAIEEHLEYPGRTRAGKYKDGSFALDGVYTRATSTWRKWPKSRQNSTAVSSRFRSSTLA